MEGEQKPDNNQADRAAWREQQKQAYAQAREEFYDRKKSDADPHPGGSFDEQMRAQSEAKKTKIDEEMKRASAEGNSAEARTDSGGAGTAGTGGSESTSGPNPEDIAQAELNQAVNDFEAKQSQIAQMRAKKTGRFASLAKSLGIKTRDLSNDPEVMSLEEESHDLYRNLISKGIHLYKGDRQQLENFLQDHDEFEVFRSTYDKEMDERAKSCGWPENVLAGFQKIGQKWSEMSWKKKLFIGGAMGGLMTVGAIGIGAGVGAFGAASLMTGWRWAFRGFGAMAAGVGRKMQLDVSMMKGMESDQEKWLQQKMAFLEQYENNIDQGIEEILNGTRIQHVREEYEQKSFENTIRARNLALKSFAISSVLGESFRYASQATGINIGSILKKIGGYAGIGGGSMTQHYEPGKFGSAGYGTETEGHDVVEAYQEGKYGEAGYGTEGEGHDDIVKSASERYGYGRYGSAGYGTEAEGHVNEFDEKYGPEKFGTETEGHDVVEAHQEGKYGEAGYGTETEDHASEPVEKYGPEGHGSETEGHVSEPETQTGESSGAYLEGKYGTETDGHVSESEVQAAEISKPQLEQIANVKIKAGGSMWGSIENNIKANPKDFGLNPDDPNFTKDMHKMTQTMLNEFASRKGLSYEQLDQIARTKLRAGDSFKIVWDTSNDDIYIDDFHGKAFGADISHGTLGASVEEIASSKPQISHEPTVKHGAGVVDNHPKGVGHVASEHQPSRGGGKMKFSPEIEDMDRKANAKWNAAVQHEQEWNAKRPGFAAENADKLAKANHRIFLNTRGLWDSVLVGANFGGHTDVWNSPASEICRQIKLYVAQDVIEKQAVDNINENMVRLGAIFKAFGDPPAGMKMNEYFMSITSKAANIPVINALKSTPIEDLLKPLRK